MNLDFTYQVHGLDISCNIINEVPSGQTPEWDFGDYTELSRLPQHTYEKPGFYQVTLKIGSDTCSKRVVVTDKACTQLTDSIYNLINFYIPEELGLSMESSEKEMYIRKWQLFIFPLVNHRIPKEEYNNELYYEGLENQLVMECAVHDWLYVKLINLIATTGNNLRELTSSSETHEGEESAGTEKERIKSITTGPTEVQYYDSLTDSISSLYKTYVTAMQPGGILDRIRQNLCMLATRLEIWLPICNKQHTVTVPQVDNFRYPGVLGGPNPTSVLTHGNPSHHVIPDNSHTIIHPHGHHHHH